MEDELTRGKPVEADILERSVFFLVNLVTKNLKLICLAGLIGGIIGASVSFLVPKQYKSQVQLLPEFKESRLSGFSSLASLAGVDLSTSSESDAIRPDLYPSILQSTPTIIYLLKQQVTTTDKKNYPMLLNYLDQETEEKTDTKSIKSFNPKLPVSSFSKQEQRLIQELKSRVETNFDKKSGIIYISVEMRDPLVAATVSSNAVGYLTKFVSDYRSQKKIKQSEFIQSRVQDASKQLQKAEYALQSYRDKNRNVYMNVAKIEEQKLQAEYLHSQNLRSDLMNQLEQAKLAEKQDEAVLQVLEPSIVPIGKSRPSRIIFAVIGAVLSVISLMIYLVIKKS